MWTKNTHDFLDLDCLSKDRQEVKGEGIPRDGNIICNILSLILRKS